MALAPPHYQLVVRPEAAANITAEQRQLLERHSYELVTSSLVPEGQALIIDLHAFAAGWWP